MNKQRLEHLSWKMMGFMGKNNIKTYSQIYIMEVCKVNIIDAIEISEFLVNMKACKYIG